MAIKYKIKKGDTVTVIAGDDKGKQGKVLKVIPDSGKVVVEGVKLVKKAVKPTEKNPDGGFNNKEMPVDISNVKKVEEA
jgi:large subunit ribosomal protein L24